MKNETHWVLKYGSAILFCGLALLVIWATPLRSGFPFLIFMGAVVLTARYGGFLPALLATALASMASLYFFLAPAFSADLSSQDAIRLVVFVVVSLMISSLTVARERAQAAVGARAQQQAAVAELGQSALGSTNLSALLDKATRIVSQTLDVEYCEVLELLPDGKALLLRAGHGWKEGMVGHATVDTDSNSLAGYTLQGKEPIIVRDLRTEKRFNGPSLLQDHSVVSGMTVIIYGSKMPFGILGAHSTRARAFNQDDASFLQAIANVLASAIERDRTEALVRDQANWLSVTLASIGDGVIATDRAGNITLFNSVAQAITGWSDQDAIGKPAAQVLDLSAEKTGESLHPRIAALTQENIRFAPNEHTQLKTKGGTLVPVDLNAAMIYDQAGEAIGAVLSLRDVTERRQAEHALQESEERYRTVAETASDAIVTIDQDGKIRFVNHAAEEIFGYSVDELLDRDLSLLMPTGEHRRWLQAIQHYLETSEKQLRWNASEFTARHKSGRIIPVEIAFGEFHRNGQRHFTGIIRDVSERKQTEQRLAVQYRVARVLAESERLGEATPGVLRAICQSLDWEIGIAWTLDAEADMLRCLDVWHIETFSAPEFEQLTRELLLSREVGLPGRVWASAIPAWVPDITQEPNAPRAKAAVKNGLHGAMAFSITSGGRFVGVLEFYSRHVRPPDTNLTNLLDSLGSQIGQFIERKRAEEALRLVREQQSIILHGVADGVTAQAVNGELIYANNAATQLIGFGSSEELLATPVAQVMSRFQVFDEAGQPLSLSQLPGRIAIVEKRNVERLLRFRAMPEGEERWSFVRASPVLDDQGRVQFAINIFHDVTESRLAEKQIREQSELFRVTLTSIGDGVIASDRYGRITFMNGVAEALTGWKAEEALGQSLDTVFRILNEETGAVMESPASRVLREQQVVKLEEGTLLIARDGRRIVLDDSGAPIRDAQGSLVGVVVTFRDATQRRRTERDISQLASIVQSTDDAILTMTLEGIVQTWNPGAEALYGYAGHEIIGKSIMITYPPEHRDELRDIVARIKRGEPTTHFETQRIRKDGQRIDVSVTPSALRNPAGKLVGISKIARDITESKRAERAQRFLADAGEVLSSSLDYETTLKSVAQLAVPQMADWCSVHIKADDGGIQQLALAHIDPNKLKLAYQFQKQYPTDPNAPTGIPKVIRTGKPELVRYISDQELATAARDVEHLGMLLELNPRSYMIVPLIARGRTLGALTFLSSESGRRYGETDLALAQELARRAALAVDNVRLYQHAQALNEELERRVIDRTIELQRANRRLESEIAERQQANEQLRLLSGHLQSAREDERVRIAREIHDEIGQVLTAVKMDLSLLERQMVKEGRAPTPDQVREEFDSTRHLVDQALDTMHGIVRELRPEILDHLGLQAAIEWQVQEFQSRTSIVCQLDCGPEEIDLDEERSIAVFRILQETLTNVARHSGATEVRVLLKQEDHHVVLRVQDNGKGVDEQALRESKTFGVLGMRERAHVFGGQVDIQGTPGKGTVVSIRIPL